MTQTDERTIGQLVASLPREIKTLVSGEIALAKAEVKQAIGHAARASGLLVVAAFLAYVAFLMLSVAAAFGLVALGLHPALGFLLVALVFILMAVLLGLIGYRTFRRVGPPKRAIEEADRIKGTLTRKSSAG